MQIIWIGDTSWLTKNQQVAVESIAFERSALAIQMLRMREQFDTTYLCESIKTLLEQHNIKPSKLYLVYFRSIGRLVSNPIPYLYQIYANGTDFIARVLQERSYKRLNIKRIDTIINKPDLILWNSREDKFYVADAKYTRKTRRRIYAGDILRLFVYAQILRQIGENVYRPTFIISTDDVYVPRSFHPEIEDTGFVYNIHVQKPIRTGFSVLPITRCARDAITEIAIKNNGEYTVTLRWRNRQLDVHHGKVKI